ncbi:MAG: DUF177 domain-containing protein [Proteobacteria bacterium]|nr:DUF177 domain-containing protein [Pseudomonadota bacterium]
MSNTRDWTPPLSRPVPVATVPAHGLDVKVTPTPDERAAMAKALDLAAVDALTADLHLTHRSGGIIAVNGVLKATIQPVCVLSLEPFPLTVSEPVEITFADEDHAARLRGRVGSEEDVSGEDPPDVIENGSIDLGHVVTEFLSLALPIYPRKPGAAFAGAAEPERESPFDKLKTLKTKE